MRHAVGVHDTFLDPRFPSLKICGVTRAGDAEQLVAHGVAALGVNFWPQSKRYLDPESAGFLASLAGRILRVGVFVNAPVELPRLLFQRGWIDVVQLHGDEPEADLVSLLGEGIPVIRAMGIAAEEDLESVATCPATAVLLDAYAPGEYGGTGRMIDWPAVGKLVAAHPGRSVVLAGGIGPENVAQALSQANPAAIDVASGAEQSPGVKDFDKVAVLQQACEARQRELTG